MHGLFLYFSSMKYFLYIFYRYYKSSRYESIPYISTLIVFAISMVLYLGSVYLIIFPETELPDKNTFVFWILSALVMICFLVWYFIREKDLQNPEFEKRYDSSHGFLALIFLIGGLMLFFIATIYSNAQKEQLKNTVDEVIFKEIPTIKQEELREAEAPDNLTDSVK